MFIADLSFYFKRSIIRLRRFVETKALQPSARKTQTIHQEWSQSLGELYC